MKNIKLYFILLIAAASNYIYNSDKAVSQKNNPQSTTTNHRIYIADYGDHNAFFTWNDEFNQYHNISMSAYTPDATPHYDMEALKKMYKKPTIQSIKKELKKHRKLDENQYEDLLDSLLFISAIHDTDDVSKALIHLGADPTRKFINFNTFITAWMLNPDLEEHNPCNNNHQSDS